MIGVWGVSHGVRVSGFEIWGSVSSVSQVVLSVECLVSSVEC